MADLLDRALANLDTSFTGSANVKGDLYNALGDTYYGLRLYEKAVVAHEKARDVRRAVLGVSHPSTLASMNKLGLAYLSDGRTADAIKLHEETVKLRRKELGPDHPDTLGSMSNLANAYRSAGRLDEAIAMHQQALKHLKTNPGIDHPYTLASMSNLALDYQQAGRLPEAIALFQETLKLRQAKLGTDHPDTLASMASSRPGLQDRRKVGRGDSDSRGDAQAPASEAGHRPPGHAQKHEQPRHGSLMPRIALAMPRLSGMTCSQRSGANRRPTTSPWRKP